MSNLVNLPLGKVGNLKVDVSTVESDVTLEVDPTLGIVCSAAVKVQNKVVAMAACELLKKMIPNAAVDSVIGVIETEIGKL